MTAPMIAGEAPRISLLNHPIFRRNDPIDVALHQAFTPKRKKKENIEIRRNIPQWAMPLRVPARYKGAKGGRSSGKSHFFAEEMVEACALNPSLRAVCIREVQRSLKLSAKALIESKIRLLGVGELFDIRATEIRRVDGSGLIIFEGMQDHTADTIKSLEGFGLAWVEEAQSISKTSLDLLLPTIRVEDSELWFSWNPEQPTDPVDLLFAGKPEGSAQVSVTYKDNPLCPEVMHKEAARLEAVDLEAYEHIWGGGYNFGGKGRVYSKFKNKPAPIGNVDESIEDMGGELLVGMDFNVEPMTAVIGQRAIDELQIFDEVVLEVGNTEDMALAIRVKYPNRRIVVCPDPSGKQRKTSAPVGQTDYTILEKYGFEVRAPSAAPAVVDRENNANAMYLDLETKRRRALIHPDASSLITALSNLPYKDGRRDKKSPFDHIADAMDYLLWQEFNVLEEAPGEWGTSTWSM